MSSTASIGNILSSLSSDLQLDWQHKKISLPQGTCAYHNWAGLLQPDRKHIIEIIDNRHLHNLNTSLLEHSLSTTWIVCENVRLTSEISAAHMQSLNLIYTPLPATELIPALLMPFAEQLSTHANKHGVFMQIFDQGVLVTGTNGIGKSSLALELIERQHRLIADDAPLFYRFPETTHVYGICPALLQGFLHVHDLGTLHIGKLFGSQALTGVSPLDLVIELDNTGSHTQKSQLSPYHRCEQLLGKAIPVINLSIKGHRNLALMVETAVKNHILYGDGYDANQALSNKLQQELENSTE